MKVLKILMFAGLILAVSGTAGAVGIPYQAGPLVAHLTDYDMGVTYTGNLIAGGAATIGVAYDPSLLVKNVPATMLTGESSWGIFQIDTIYAGNQTGGNIIAPTGSALYTSGGTTAIVGIFFGAHDTSVTFNASGSQTINRTGDKYQIYTETTAQLNAIMPSGFGSLGQTARLSDYKYTGIGFDAAGNPLAGAELCFTGNTENGMAPFGVQSNFTPSGNSGTGDFNGYIDVGSIVTTGGSLTGTQNGIFNTNYFPEADIFSQPFVAGSNADVHLKGNTTPTIYNWLVSSSDPLMANAAVPEPVTMLGLFLSIGGIGAYIRRRRMAV